MARPRPTVCCHHLVWRGLRTYMKWGARERLWVGWEQPRRERETITLTLLAYWLGTPGLSPVSHWATLLSPVLPAAGQNMALLVSPASACLHLPGHPSALPSRERRDISLIVITPHHSLQTISLPGPSTQSQWSLGVTRLMIQDGTNFLEINLFLTVRNIDDGKKFSNLHFSKAFLLWCKIKMRNVLQ